jgi:hypothetical protein
MRNTQIMPPFDRGGSAAAAAAGRDLGAAGGSVRRCREVGAGSSTVALALSFDEGGGAEAFLGGASDFSRASFASGAVGWTEVGAWEVRAPPMGRSEPGGSLLVVAGGMEPGLVDTVAGVGTPISVAVAPGRAGLPASKSGLLPISSIDPPASLSASSRSSAACFMTVFSFTGPSSGALVVVGNIPPPPGGGGLEAPIPMIVSLRTSPGRSEPGFAGSTTFGRSEMGLVAALTDPSS